MKKARNFLACFANVQEGRDATLLRRLAQKAGSVRGASLVQVFSDRVFHRSGFLIVGEPVAVGNAAYALASAAVESIDLTSEERIGDDGIHHHIGAVDLLPMYPLGGTSLEEAAGVANTVAARMGIELGVPVLTYGAAHPSGRSLVEVRRQTTFFGQEGRKDSLTPDFGPAKPDQGTGITVCGASPYVVNFNAVLGTTDMKLGRAIAKLIRGREPGGLPGVQAMAYSQKGLEGQAVVEVACNLTDPASALGRASAVEARIGALAQERGCSLLYAYTTNPTPQQLQTLLASGLPVAGEFSWKVPPGHTPFQQEQSAGATEKIIE